VALEEDFPNTGMLGWWQPPADADLYKAWMFSPEESNTYDPSKDWHDRFFVRNPATPATEFITLHKLLEPEDVRLCLMTEGLSQNRCTTRRLVFETGDGCLLGPVELVLRGDRLFLEERETAVAISQSSALLELTTWNNHVFMPPEFSLTKIGDLDLSTNSLFVKRMLRESRDISSGSLETAKLTAKQIAAYSLVLESLPMTKSRQQRLRRLVHLTKDLNEHISLQEEGLASLLALPDVAAALKEEGRKARQAAVDEKQKDIEKLAVKQQELKFSNTELEQASLSLKQQLSSDQLALTEAHMKFEASIARTFSEAEENAPAFLGSIALIRAAIGGSNKAIDSARSLNAANWFLTDASVEIIGAPQLRQAVAERFEVEGIEQSIGLTLLSTWASSLIPVLNGDVALEAP
jgi:hypothetical protein